MSRIRDPKLLASIKSFLTVYLPKIRARSPHTVQAYKNTLNQYTRFLKAVHGIELWKLEAADFNVENVLAFLEWIKSERGCADSTRNQRLMNIRFFCKYLAGEDVLAVSVYSKIQEVKRLPVPRKVLDDILTVDDVKLLLEMPGASTKKGLRDRFYLALLYDTGCRNDEILSIKLGDISYGKDNGQVNVIGKGKKFRATPISKEVVAMLRQYAHLFHPESNSRRHLFYTDRKGVETQMSPDNTARILSKIESKVKVLRPDITHLHPHLFRHVRAMHLYQAGMPLSLIGEWLGHSQLETTRIYAYANTQMKRDAIDKLNISKPSVFTDEQFMFQDDDDTLRKLYGLA